MHFLFLTKSPSKRTPPGSPTGAPMETAACLHDIFYISLKFLIKITLNKEILFHLSKALGKERFSMFPKRGAPMERDANFRRLT